uniref:SHSP domain-containing protein n=1 Tax=Amphilophus citrinellus TaxID=61819 RepID=A0A3Q0SQD3_AMPCI
MSQHAALTSLFNDDPFFSQEQLLWPLNLGALSSLQRDFFNQRAKLADSLLRELHDGPQLLKLKHRYGQLTAFDGEMIYKYSFTFRVSDDEEQQRELSTTEAHKEVQQAKENNSDLLVTLDARGYAPSDITVKLEGRCLAVVSWFVQKIDLPPHLDLSGLSCSLMDNGQLRIHAPVAKQAVGEEQQVPIRFKTSLEFPIKKDNTEEEQGD